MALLPTAPLPLHHSWPLFDARARMDGALLRLLAPGGLPAPDLITEDEDQALAEHGIGLWQCDLPTERLTWTTGVYDLFGLPRGMAMERGLSASLYMPQSRIAMEELRAHAIRHKRGFTVDVELRQPCGDHRWMRLSACPVLAGGKVVRLCGVKQDVTGDYDSGPRARMAA